MEDYSQLSLENLRRKRDQAWDLAGLARQDGDMTDCLRWTTKAKDLQREIKERLFENSSS